MHGHEAFSLEVRQGPDVLAISASKDDSAKHTGSTLRRFTLECCNAGNTVGRCQFNI